MSMSIREAIYWIAELQALGHSKAELLDSARTAETSQFSAERILELADDVYIRVFACAA